MDTDPTMRKGATMSTNGLVALMWWRKRVGGEHHPGGGVTKHQQEAIDTMTEPPVELSAHRAAGSAESGGSPAMMDADELLMEFLRGRDVVCPRCSYNLRDLSRAQCPECQERLSLAVERRVPLAPLLVTVMPGFFSIVAAALLALPLIFAEGEPPLGMYAIDAFGWLSGFFALFLCLRRDRFVRLGIGTQWFIAGGVWAVHVTVFLLLVAGVIGA